MCPEERTDSAKDQVLEEVKGMLYSLIIQFPDFDESFRPLILKIENVTSRSQSIITSH